MKHSNIVILLSCLLATTLTAPIAIAAAHGGGFGGAPSFAARPGMNMPGRLGMGMPGRAGAVMPGRFGMGMRGRLNEHDHFDHHHDHFHHHHDRFHDEDVVFIGSFGFPLWWGWGWGYPYGYYGYGDYSYGNYRYGYANSSRSRVVELQRRLAQAGYYHGSIDGVVGPQTRSAIRAYERDNNMSG